MPASPGAIVLLANVGNRDLQLDGEDPKEPARSFGERILADFGTYRERLSVPMLEASLRYIVRENDRPLDAIVLFSTDQPESILDRHRGADTLPAAEAIRRVLIERFVQGKRPADRLLRDKLGVQVVPLRNFSPHLLDEAYRAYDRLLALPIKGAERIDRCYTAPVGGIPACNQALTLQSILRYGDRATLLYAEPSARGSETIRLQFAELLLDRLKLREARRLLEARQFQAVATILSDGGERSRALGLLAGAVAARLEFNFDSAASMLQNMPVIATQSDLSFAREQLRQLRALQRTDPEAQLLELFWNARAALEQERLTDYVARIARLHEAMLRYIAERLLGFECDGAPGAPLKRFRASMQTKPGLLAWLEQQVVDGQPLRADNPTSTVLLEQIIAYYALHPDETPPAGHPTSWEDTARRNELIDTLTRLGRQKKLRNRTIIGHGFRGLTRVELETHDPGLTDAASLLTLVGLSWEPDPFDGAYQQLIREIDRLVSGT